MAAHGHATITATMPGTVARQPWLRRAQREFSGSTGFGKAFINAGDGEWGRRMDDDLCDAVAWAVAEGHADPARIAIMGTSYGGYATLVGLTRNPELYACGVDIVGPSNLETLLRTIPPYWESIRADLYRRSVTSTPPRASHRRVNAHRCSARRTSASRC